MKKSRSVLLWVFTVTAAICQFGCFSAHSIGSGDVRPLSAIGAWIIIPPSAYTKLFPGSPTEGGGDIKVNVFFRGKTESQLLQSGKHLDNILTKISSAEKIPVTSLAWIALVKMSIDHGPVAIICPVKQYLDTPVTLDSIVIEEGDGVVVLTEREFTDAAEVLARMLAAAGSALAQPVPDVTEEPEE